MASKYVYQRHLPANSIRLLTLVSDGTEFRGFLEEFRRDNLPYFNALSWCWWSRGERQDTAFTCDGQDFPVSQHLYQLLDNLNPKGAGSSVRIWIDCICINQDHVAEKNVHVAHMHEIYGRAQNVIVWLGMPEDDSDLVLNSRRVSELLKTLQHLPGSMVTLSPTAPKLPHANDPLWKAIGRLCDRPWFYRTWVIQEIALARKAELLCGSQQLDWDIFVDLIQSISRVGLASICQGPRSTVMTRPNGFGVLMDLSWTRTMVQNNNLSMSYLLHMVRLKEVTKPVDKVYGLLGIIDEDTRSAIEVNYAENDRQYWKAYVDLAQHIVAADDAGFWLLSMASSRERPKQLPTWCPNFNSLTPEYLDFENQKWQAGLGNKGADGAGIRVIRDSSRLQILGFHIDVVDKVFRTGGPYSAAVEREDLGRDGNMAAFLEKDKKCLELTLQLFDDPNSARDAYARTLVINSWISGLAIQPSQTERVRNAYEDSKAYLAPSNNDTTAATNILADDERLELAKQYITQLGWWQERSFYTTKNGRIGRGAFHMRAGDALCIFYRAGPVFILRYELESEAWKLVGDAYLHGCMNLDSISEDGRGPDVEFTIC